MSDARPGFPRGAYLTALAVIVVLTLWPLGSVAIAHAIADANGCKLVIGSNAPCLVGGADWGPTLFLMDDLGWFIVFTFAFGICALIVLALVLAIHHIVWKRRAPAKDFAP